MVWWLGWSHWSYEEMVSNLQPFEGVKGAWNCKQERESAQTCVAEEASEAVIECKKL